jgi:hypothetical protein
VLAPVVEDEMEVSPVLALIPAHAPSLLERAGKLRVSDLNESSQMKNTVAGS